MEKSRLFYVIFVFCILNNVLVAQPIPVQNFATDPRATTYRKSFWTEFNLGGTISKNKRWQYQIDYQYRRMADANYIQGGQTGNIFKDPYQQVFRPWIHYWLIPGVLRFSLSPIGYWVTWTPSEETSIYPNKNGVTTGQSIFPEFRICPQITTQQYFGRVLFVNRFRYEFRYVGERTSADSEMSFNFSPTDVGSQSASLGWYGNNQTNRLRIQTRVQIPINHKTVSEKTLYVNVWNELFLATGPRIKNDKLLNQNRLVGLLGYRFPGKIPIKIEAGFTYQTLYFYNIDSPPTNPSITYQKANVEENFAYTIYIICDEFHKLFAKREAENESK
jgi:hypothetical protein